MKTRHHENQIHVRAYNSGEIEIRDKRKIYTGSLLSLLRVIRIIEALGYSLVEDKPLIQGRFYRYAKPGTGNGEPLPYRVQMTSFDYFLDVDFESLNVAQERMAQLGFDSICYQGTIARCSYSVINGFKIY